MLVVYEIFLRRYHKASAYNINSLTYNRQHSVEKISKVRPTLLHPILKFRDNSPTIFWVVLFETNKKQTDKPTTVKTVPCQMRRSQPATIRRTVTEKSTNTICKRAVLDHGC